MRFFHWFVFLLSRLKFR